MTAQALETDYLVVGSGAMGMAFTDEILTRSPEARVLLVDKHARPGGHWNDAYSYVSLHQPAAFYGVNSEKLGSGGAELASGSEVLAYFEKVMRKYARTGRLKYLPMCEWQGEGRVRSLIQTDLEYQVTAKKKTVDATYMNVQVPSIRGPQFEVASDLSIVAPNELPQVRDPRSGYVIIGAGKTGIDAVLFLLDQGVDQSHITWIMPNDSWLLDRDHLQPGRIAQVGASSQLQLFAKAKNLDELFSVLEAGARILRLDRNVWPTKYRCATVNQEELKRLRTVQNIVRMGRVERIESTSVVLEKGSIPTDPEKLHVDCTADGLASRPVRPVFEGNRITLQSLFMCQQVFSASVIGYVETRYSDEKQMNDLCHVVPHPEFSRDFVLAMAVTGQNMEKWGRKFPRWLRSNRLCVLHHDSLFAFILAGIRSRKFAGPAAENMQRILEQEFPQVDLSGIARG